MDRYWIGGSGNWSDTSHWSDTSGGAGGFSYPLATDNAFFDSNSGVGTLTLDIIDPTCLNLDFTSSTLLSMTSSEVGLTIYGNLTLTPGMTITNVLFYMGATTPGFTIDTQGSTIVYLDCFGIGGVWTLLNDITVSGDLIVDDGKLVTANKIISTGLLACGNNSGGHGILDLGSSVIHCLGFECLGGGSVIAGTSQINLTTTTSGFYGNNQSYYDLLISGGSTMAFYGSNSFHLLQISGSGNIDFAAGSVQTCTDFTATTAHIFSQTTGSQYTIHSTNVPTIHSLTVEDCIAAGAIPFIDSSGTDLGNNLHWLFLGSSQLYWVGGSGDFNDSAHWSLTSGGAGGAGPPTLADDAIFDANSFSGTGQIVNVPDAYGAAVHDLIWTGALHNPTLQFTGTPSGSSVSVYGTLVQFTINMSVTFIGTAPRNTSLLLRNTAPLTLDTQGVSIPIDMQIEGSAQVTLGSALTTTSTFQALMANTFDTGGYAMSVGTLSLDNSTFNAHASVITLTGYNYDEVINGLTFNSTSVTWNDGGSTIIFAYDANALNVNFYDLELNGQSIGSVRLIGSGGVSNPWQITDATLGSPGSTVANLFIAPGNYVVTQDGSVITTTAFTANGSLGNAITLRSLTPGSTYQYNATSANVSYVNVQDCVAGGAGIPFNDFVGGVDAGNNTNWIFNFPVAGDNLISVYEVELLDSDNNLVAVLTGYIANLSVVITRNRPEEISFSIPVSLLQKIADDSYVDISNLLLTGQQTIRIKRKGIIICAGQLDYWSMDFQDPTVPVVQYKAHGWLSLLSYRLVSTLYINRDANFILHDIITATQSIFPPDGNFGITFGATAVGTNLYPFKQYQDKSVQDILVEFSEEDKGIDFNFTWDKIFNVYWPSMGQQRPDILFTYPGNIQTLSISSDTTQIANHIYARAQGNGGAEVEVDVFDTPSRSTYKLREAIKDYPDTPDETQVSNFLKSELRFAKDPLMLHNITYLGSDPSTPQVGTYYVGDQIRIIALEFPFLTSVLNDYFIIDKQTINVDNTGKEVVQLDFVQKAS